jgi:hypothetical protein
MNSHRWMWIPTSYIDSPGMPSHPSASPLILILLQSNDVFGTGGFTTTRRMGWGGRRLETNIIGQSTPFVRTFHCPLPYSSLSHRLYPPINNDSLTTVRDAAASSKRISAATMCIPQCTDERTKLLVVRRPPMRQDGLPPRNNNYTGGSLRRGVDHSLEPRRQFPSERKQGQTGHHLADRGVLFFITAIDISIDAL